jgi:hypothetical protein
MPVEAVTVLGGGWSAAEIDKDRLPGFVIGVNDAALLARCDVGLSMDRLWIENRIERITAKGLGIWVRRAALKNVAEHPYISVFDCDHTTNKFADDHCTLNGTNSGACAFNLAFQLRPKRINLVGFDMGRGPNGEVYWYPPYSWRPDGGTGNARYAEWSQQFDEPMRQCERVGIHVVNVNRRETIKGMARIDPQAFMSGAA